MGGREVEIPNAGDIETAKRVVQWDYANSGKFQIIEKEYKVVSEIPHVVNTEYYTE